MNIKTHWWKILGVIILLYVLIAGILVPLKTGIFQVSPQRILSNANVDLEIVGYNSHFLSNIESNEVWLKMNSTSGLKAHSLEVIDDRHILASFHIGHLDFGGKKILDASLITYNDQDKTAILPGGITIIPSEQISSEPTILLEPLPLERWQLNETFSFPYRNILHETVRNTFFHVSLWFSMFFLLLVALVYSILELRHHSMKYDIIASSYTKVAILYGILGVITGSIWARFTWGQFWTTDIKLNMTVIALLIYMAYVILRNSISDQDKRARVSASYNIFAFVVMIPLLFIIPRINSSLHPGNGGNPALGGEDLDHTLRMVFYPAIIGFTLLGVWIASLKVRLENIRENQINQVGHE